MKNKEPKAKKTNKFFSFFKSIGPVKHIFIVYILFTLIISLLLYWPITHTNDLKVIKPNFDYSDALFLASSAFSDTGLSTLAISKGFNGFGQAIIAIAIFVGGLGIFAIKVYVIQNIFGFKMSVFNSQVSQTERGANTWGDTKKLIKVSISFLLIVLVLAVITFTLIFYFSPHGRFYNENITTLNKTTIESEIADYAQANNVKEFQVFNPYESELANPKGNLTLSLRYAVFHSISSLCNAGFDIFGSKSLQPFYFDWYVQTFTIILIFIGGIGYPVIYDVYQKLVSLRKNKPRHRFNLFTKLTLITYLFVTVIGFLLTILFETISKNPQSFWNQKQYGNTAQKIGSIFFQTVSTRSAGFTVVDYYHFSTQSIIVHAILMFIGFSPVSTAGGIRNITIAVIFLSIITMIRGKTKINAFKRQIGKETLIKAVNIFAIGVALILIGVLITYSSYEHSGLHLNNVDYKQFDISHITFEVCSAFGSSGLSTGLTSELGLISKLLLILYMFIGQLGITQTILIWGKANKRPDYYEYIYEDVSIG
ncbi:TrkH family potassium uptake protein [[Mycoplasma] anseris]|uniref:TrkH family potassium uptake protein n=1 Tax=[Mycoplasma] anseris TaxID=92400 RepID=A0A2Z4NDG1_9BACT|nr:potassium transporter TrkG [[Mycoplasma] anseris]AWX69546.1 TrkH family potassium uptake protein [[Mycoplasma] anseris]